ncbi:unnamed protein product [Candida verbasci]|uniref:Phosphoribosylglycinamide formyltransferase n=1 Tax=Candida verbasci TaxID=1227364 RepID=A0A9W4TTK9_9ASCO|nr:unnamed protein product [Candida verbasci]
MTLKITVLISGSGTNLQALIDANLYNAEITRVISSSSTAYGLTRAEKAGIATKIHALKNYYQGIPKEEVEQRNLKREQFNIDLANLLINENKPDLIVCAGWMLILSPSVLKPLEDAGITIINLHPALPGQFDGTHAIDRCWKEGQEGKITKGGVMIHKVITEVDRGEPILVKELDLIKGETLQDYEERVHKIEHIAIVEGTNKILKELSI